jgi:membrane-bound lytic murein transglycosylase B
MLSRLFILLLSFLLCNYCLAKKTELNFADRPDVKIFIKKMVKKHHFKKAKLVKLFKTIKVRPAVVNNINYPLERRPWYTYGHLFVNEWRIREGVEFWNKHRTALEFAEKKYGVPANIIVATIGVETKYGKHTGEYPVIDALANIGFSKSPRAKFFRNELEQFLLLTREQHLNPLKVMGSYAGAIGQPQFMPSSYRHYAVSYSGHSKIDLSHNEKDVIVSIANYYKKFGWKSQLPIATPASIVGSKYQFFLDKNKDVRISSYSTLRDYGIIPKEALSSNQQFKLLQLRGYWGNEYWLTFHNFDVIKRYNPSDLYAMAVFQLGHYISELREKLQND